MFSATRTRSAHRSANARGAQDRVSLIFLACSGHTAERGAGEQLPDIAGVKNIKAGERGGSDDEFSERGR